MASPVVQQTLSSRVTMGGAGALQEATGTFTFTDASTGATTAVTLTLSAARTRLTGAGTGLLLQGDETQDSHGNRLVVQSGAAQLTTTA